LEYFCCFGCSGGGELKKKGLPLGIGSPEAAFRDPA